MSASKDRARRWQTTVKASQAEQRRAERRRNFAISAVVAAVFVAVVGRLAINASGSADRGGSAAAAGAEDPRLIRPDSQRLSTAPDGKVTVVEFLDFECEACRAAFPTVERLRKNYAGKVTFVARYFPISSHFNAQNAAVAVEAAAQQGAFETMCQRMYETQAEWSEQQVSKADVFRGFAADRGLDMAAYDAAVADPKTLERVLADRDDGLALGVQGTTTIFLNGEQIQPRSYRDFKDRIDAALAG